METDDQILRRKLAEMGGWLAGFITRFMPTDCHTEEFTVSLPLDAVARVITGTMYTTAAEVVRTVDLPESFSCDLVFGSGYMHMNPAVVHITARSNATEQTTVTILAKAKEGLVRQRGGYGAACEIAELLQNKIDEKVRGTTPKQDVS